MRKLVTIRMVDAIVPIPDADAIELAVLGGWQAVVKRGEYAVGDRAVYFEVDSALPLADPRFAFLAARGIKDIDGEDFHVLSTAKLRGALSQGLILPLAQVPEVEAAADLAAALGVRLYEPPLPSELAGAVRGTFPTHLARRTDAERVQNLGEVYARFDADQWYATEKIDGTSTTYIVDSTGLRVCGRNYEWVPSPEQISMQVAEREGLLTGVPAGWVLQGELYGKGIQRNRFQLDRPEFRVFAAWREGREVPRTEWPQWAMEHAVPIYTHLRLPTTVAEAVHQVDGLRSLVAPGRLAEGVVWHGHDAVGVFELGQRSHFKVVSNTWLLKG